MEQKLIKIGTSVGVVIPKPLLKMIGYKAGAPLSVEKGSRPGTILVRFAGKANGLSKREERVLSRTDSFIARYRKDLDRLKDA